MIGIIGFGKERDVKTKLQRHHQNRKSPPKAAVRTAIRVHLHLGSSLAIFRNHAAYCFSKIVPQRFNTHQPPRPSSRFSSILVVATASNHHHQIASVTAARPSRRDLHRHPPSPRQSCRRSKGEALPQSETLILGGKGADTCQHLIGSSSSGQSWSTSLLWSKSGQLRGFLAISETQKGLKCR
ncbi:hypothetical protein LR48_Vigan11g052300 [Vigna angularis]|uniref:Uncharacterized protein n=1 Tax=Phaseolus angularis TaxID=3914 RepID=A0A0L9VR11_PHAAN|nr:hypothetical protein LR48_Vigan11g052300 [Vigna angularis]